MLLKNLHGERGEKTKLKKKVSIIVLESTKTETKYLSMMM